MNKEIKELGSMIDNIKEKITSNEYKEIMDKMMNINTKNELYKIHYVENKILHHRCNSKRLTQSVKESIVQLDLPHEVSNMNLDRLKTMFHNFYFDNKLSIYRIISAYQGEEEFILSTEDSDDENDIDFTLLYSQNLLISIEKYNIY